jgi:hypothetical protein
MAETARLLLKWLTMKKIDRKTGFDGIKIYEIVS